MPSTVKRPLLPLPTAFALTRTQRAWHRRTNGLPADASTKTTTYLERFFWLCLEDVAADLGTTVSDLLATTRAEAPAGQHCSYLRVYVAAHYRDRVARLTRQCSAPAEEAHPLDLMPGAAAMPPDAD